MRHSRNVPLSLALAAGLALISALVLASPAAALEQKLVAADGGPGGRLGDSVAIDGDTAVIGAPERDVGENGEQGAVYVFTRSGDSWTETAKLTASDGAAGDQLGFSVAIDGDTIVAGANLDDVGESADQGSAYTFARTGDAARSETAKLTASDGAAGDQLGFSVAIEDDSIVAGAPADNGSFFFDVGSAYTFARTGAAARTETAKLTASDGTAQDAFGISVAIDGDTIVAGASGDNVGANTDQGSAYTFPRTGAAARTETAKLTASDGQGREEPGSDGTFGDAFGISVAIDGDTIVVGAPFDDFQGERWLGSAYTFARTGAAARTETAKLTASDGATEDRLGTSVAIDGDTIVAGAPFDDFGEEPNQGSAYIFARTGAAPRTETAKLTASDGAAVDGLGDSVGIDGDTIIAGAPLDRVGESFGQGSASVFFSPADSDDDGVPDAADDCPTGATTGLDTDGDGCKDTGEDTDDDNDTFADASDNCQLVANQSQANQDGDALGDACDPDRDGDGAANGSDNCVDVSNPGQQNTDGDAQGDACDPDDDNDTVADASDNCQLVANQSQANQDGDALGDACDPDRDGDGAANGSDNCVDVSNPGQQNTDGDAQGDACDPDDDNDTVADGSDDCRTLPASTPSGCPTVARSLTLSYSKSKQKFKGALAASEPSCVSNDLVTVWKQVSGDDVKAGADEVNARGRYVVSKRGRPGKYYSTVEERVVADVAACGSANSPTLRLR